MNTRMGGMRQSTQWFASGLIADAARSALNHASSYSPDASGAIVLSWIAIEGFLNEVYGLVETIANGTEDIELAKLAFFLGSYESESDGIMKRLQAMHYICKSEKLLRGKGILQELDLLRLIRNELVHLKPEVISFDESGKWKRVGRGASIVDGLRSRVEGVRIGPDEPWLELLRDERVAKWAVGMMARTAEFVMETLPDGPVKHHAKDHAKCLIEGEPHV